MLKETFPFPAHFRFEIHNAAGLRIRCDLPHLLSLVIHESSICEAFRDFAAALKEEQDVCSESETKAYVARKQKELSERLTAKYAFDQSNQMQDLKYAIHKFSANKKIPAQADGVVALHLLSGIFFIRTSKFYELLHIDDKDRRTADLYLYRERCVTSDIIRSRARYDLGPTAAVLTDDFDGTFDQIIFRTDDQRGIARTQESAGRRQTGHLIIFLRQSTRYSRTVIV